MGKLYVIGTGSGNREDLTIENINSYSTIFIGNSKTYSCDLPKMKKMITPLY